MHTPFLACTLLGAMAVLVARPAAAGDADTAAIAKPTPASTHVTHAPSTADPALLARPVDAARLDGLRGGDSSVDNAVGIDGNVSGNSATNTSSGSNVISDGAFASSAGISTVIQNSGNNVLIQNGMVVNVQFVAPGQ